MKALFIGMGSIGKRHLENLRLLYEPTNSELEIHILKRRLGDISEYAREVTRVYTDVDQVKDVYDAVFICNPTINHYGSLERFVGQGQAFFIEKPVFHTALVDLAFLKNDSEKLFYVAAPLRFHSVYEGLVQSLGNEQILSARAITSSYLPQWRKGADYRRAYSAHQEEGGGVRRDLIHEWDYLIALMGFPEEVRSFSGRVSGLEINTEDIAVYIGRYPRGFAEVHLDYFGRESIRKFEIITESRTIEGDFLNGTLRVNGHSLQMPECDIYKKEMAYFFDLIKGKVSNINSIEHALKVLKIAEGNNSDNTYHYMRQSGLEGA